MRARVPVNAVVLAIGLTALSTPVRAEGFDISLFGGLAFPTYEQRFTVRAPTVAPLPGFVIRPNGDLTIDAKGGTVFGAAVCGEVGGVIGIEARFDSTAIELRTGGLRYDVSYSAPPLPTLTGSVSIDPGPLTTDRLKLLSLNLRLRTPGPVSLVASGGVTYLPDFEVTGTTPVNLTVGGLPVLDQQASFGLRVSPTESSHRLGVNGGAGLRVKLAPGVSLFGEGRVFYFKEYELAVEVDDPTLQGFVGDIELPRFRPIVVNAVGGITFSF
jgi:hypothetical protein